MGSKKSNFRITWNMIKDFNNTGFVNFPQGGLISPVDSGKTMIYLIAFQDGFSNIDLVKCGNFCGDDVLSRQNKITFTRKIDSVIEEVKSETELEDVEKFYFKTDNFKVISSILIGWSKYSWNYTDRLNPWCCGFRDLSGEGKKLYYQMKKLHNASDIRILTFNNIK